MDDADLLRVDFPSLLVVPEWIQAHCVVPDGDEKNRPFELYDWQLHCTVNHYRVRTKARVGEKAAAFFYRRSQVLAAQKTGKGPWAATILCAEALGPVLFAGWARGDEAYECRLHGCSCGWWYEYSKGEPMGRPWPTPLLQLLATSIEQVDNVFRPLQAMARAEPLCAQMRVGEEFVRIPKNDGKIDTVTSAADSKLGNPVNFVLQDEPQLYSATNKLIKTAETMRRGAAGMGGRTMETGNTFDRSIDTTARRTYQTKARDVFRFHDEPPEHLDYSTPEGRHAVHVYNYRGSPHVNVTDIDREAAELVELDPAQAERFFGNRIKSTGDSAFDLSRWKELHRPEFMPAKGELIVVGVDGARYDDALAVVATDVVAGFQWPLGIWERPVDAPDDYEHPFEEVDAMMVDAVDRWSMWRTYIDPQYIDHLVDLWLGRWGPDRIKAWVTSRPRASAWSLRSYRQAQMSGDLSHNGDPKFTAHIGNSKRRQVNVFDDKHRPMWVIQKESPHSQLKIDGAMAGCLSWECRGDAIAAGAKKPTARRAPRRWR